MAIIAPSSIIRILKNVPLDNTYRNTIFYSTPAEQTTSMLTYLKWAMDGCTYQRTNRAIRVPRKADDLYDCNYIMYQNPEYGTKWFYAFITEVEYINNENSYVYFELDVMQTWHFEYKVNPCLIEREHSLTDAIGDNLVPDNLELGEYTYGTQSKTGFFTGKTYIVAATFDKDLNPAGGEEYMGVYSGLVYNQFTRPADVTDFIDRATEDNKADGIIGIFIMPTEFITTNNQAKLVPFHFTPSLSSIDGYTPKNKKLFTYPYNFIMATNNMGDYMEYKYEYFDLNPITGNVEFAVIGGLNNSPEFILSPTAYKGIPRNYNEKMVLNNLPVCSYSTDTFKAWWAQNQVKVPLAGLGIAAGLATAAVAAPLTAAVIVPAVLQAGNLMAEAARHQTMPDTAHGVTNANVLYAAGAYDFFFYPCSIRAEFAKMIDQYWTMYGYPSHQVKVPNRNTRPHWNFVKTIGSNITGSIPAGDLAAIRTIYDTGITFWKYATEVGNYNLDNSI